MECPYEFKTSRPARLRMFVLKCIYFSPNDVFTVEFFLGREKSSTRRSKYDGLDAEEKAREKKKVRKKYRQNNSHIIVDARVLKYKREAGEEIKSKYDEYFFGSSLCFYLYFSHALFIVYSKGPYLLPNVCNPPIKSFADLCAMDFPEEHDSIESTKPLTYVDWLYENPFSFLFGVFFFLIGLVDCHPTARSRAITNYFVDYHGLAGWKMRIKFFIN